MISRLPWNTEKEPVSKRKAKQTNKKTKGNRKYKSLLMNLNYGYRPRGLLSKTVSTKCFVMGSP